MDALTLFEGRVTAIGTEEGGALRCPDDVTSERAWWEAQVLLHFDGLAPVGVYPMVPNEQLIGPGCFIPKDGFAVKWGCIDYDEGEEESLIHATNTAKVLDMAAGIVGFVERSRSKGYHVWVFAEQWIPALVMRRALLAAAQVVNAPMREINPKQVSLAYDEEHLDFKLGNYVRLPYPGGVVDPGGKRTVLSEEGYYRFEVFVEEAMRTRCNEEQLQKMGAKFVEPVKKVRKVVAADVDMDSPWKDRLDGFTHTLLFGHGDVPPGPFPGQDRSSWLWKLCNSLIERTPLTEPEILAALVYGHDCYTPDKFYHRADEELERMMMKAMEAHD